MKPHKQPQGGARRRHNQPGEESGEIANIGSRVSFSLLFLLIGDTIYYYRLLVIRKLLNKPLYYYLLYVYYTYTTHVVRAYSFYY